MKPKKSIILTISLILFFFTFSLNCNAQDKNNRNYTKYVIENYNNDSHIMAFLAGIGEGILISDAILENVYSLDKICNPGNQSFSSSDYFAILKQQYFKMNKENLPTGVTLYIGLENTFPCR